VSGPSRYGVGVCGDGRGRGRGLGKVAAAALVSQSVCPCLKSCFDCEFGFGLRRDG